MRQLARLLLAVVVVPGLLLPQGGTYCLYRLFGIGGGEMSATCMACCCRHAHDERDAASVPSATAASDRAPAFDSCCITLPVVGDAVDANAQSRARHDAQLAVDVFATTLFVAPDDFATSVAADGRFDAAWRAPPDPSRASSVPIALPLRL